MRTNCSILHSALAHRAELLYQFMNFSEPWPPTPKTTSRASTGASTFACAPACTLANSPMAPRPMTASTFYSKKRSITRSTSTSWASARKSASTSMKKAAWKCATLAVASLSASSTIAPRKSTPVPNTIAKHSKNPSASTVSASKPSMRYQYFSKSKRGAKA